MQVVILAAGRGKRMNHLTNELPKPMVCVSGKNLIEYKLEALPEDVKEVIIVIGYLGEKIKEYFGNKWKDKKITYVEQKELQGTSSALWLCKPFLKDRFMVMMGDDIYGADDIKNCLSFDWSILTKHIKQPVHGAKIIMGKKGTIADIIERVDLSVGDLGNAGLYVLGKEIFNYPLVPIGNGEFGLPQTMVLASKDFDIKIVESKRWLGLTTPKDVEEAEACIKSLKID